MKHPWKTLGNLALAIGFTVAIILILLPYLPEF
jgi:hypothetical protein